MDMKRILQAIDGASTKPVEGANDMSRFLRLVTETEINQSSTPTPPPMPSIAGMQPGQTKEVNPGEKVTLNADGTVSHEGWWGEQIFKTDGQLVKTISPRAFGYQQQTDSSGKVISKTQSITNPDGQEMGSVTQNANGTQSSNVDLGTTVLSQKRDANGNLISGNATVRGETPAQNQTVSMEDVKVLAGIIAEGANPHKVALPVQMAMQHYQQPTKKAVAKESLIKKYFIEAEEEINKQKEHKQQLIRQYASVIAERVQLKNRTVAEGLPTPTMPNHPLNPLNPSSPTYVAKNRDNLDMDKVTARAKEMLHKGMNEQQVRDALIKQGVASRLADQAVQMGQMNEAPIDMTGDPNDPMIYGHEKANPMSLKGRIMQARAQLKDLAMRAESNDLVTWERICRDAKGGLFMGLEQNLEQIRHGISELAAKRKKGGVSSKGIDKNIGEASSPAQQAAIAISKKKEAGIDEEKQRLDPKCWKGYKKAGTKMKGGVRVNNCVPKGKKE